MHKFYLGTNLGATYSPQYFQMVPAATAMRTPASGNGPRLAHPPAQRQTSSPAKRWGWPLDAFARLVSYYPKKVADVSNRIPVLVSSDAMLLNLKHTI